MSILTAIKSKIFKSSRPQDDSKFGAFKGVFIPNVLQMIGVILFMRLGWILGNVGIVKMISIITISSFLLFITSLSMTAVVSNMKMKGGGSYYLISRMLGIEFGSAIGILLCISLLASITLCVSGFCASLQEFYPTIPLALIKTITLTVVVGISFISTNFALKTQVIIFLVLIASVFSIFIGTGALIPATLEPKALTNISLPFWSYFALFFPATTGIEAGLSLSGDLKKPSRALPIGTLSAVISVYVLYIALVFFLNNNVSTSLLTSYPFIVYYLSKAPILVVFGTWAATLSSALGSVLSAPKIMQAIAKDGILPDFLKKGYGKANLPRSAIVIMFVLALFLMLFTNINQIIPILTMSCLVSYGLINFVAFVEELIQNPSWRPTFRIPWMISLIGCIGCFAAMFMINPGATFIVVALTILLCIWTSSKNIEGNWGDMRYSLVSYLIYKSTTKLLSLEKNARSWRPHILAMSHSSSIPTNLAFFSHSLNQKKRFLTFGISIAEMMDEKVNIHSISSSIKKDLKNHNIASHVHINKTNDKPLIGMSQIVKNYGFGPLKPNSVILSLDESQYTEDLFGTLIMDTYAHGKNVILLKHDAENSSVFMKNGAQKSKQIDLWWRGEYKRNFELCLALSHVMQKCEIWKNAKICIKTITKTEEEKDQKTNKFLTLYKNIRNKKLEFKPFISEVDNFAFDLKKYSADSDLTFLGLRSPRSDETLESYKTYYLNLFERTKTLSNVAYVLSGEDIPFEKIFS